MTWVALLSTLQQQLSRDVFDSSNARRVYVPFICLTEQQRELIYMELLVIILLKPLKPLCLKAPPVNSTTELCTEQKVDFKSTGADPKPDLKCCLELAPNSYFWNTFRKLFKC